MDTKQFISAIKQIAEEKGIPEDSVIETIEAAIAAAYNPLQTKCLFYLHDKNKKIHCAKTYQEHKKNIKIYLK